MVSRRLGLSRVRFNVFGDMVFFIVDVVRFRGNW